MPSFEKIERCIDDVTADVKIDLDAMTALPMEFDEPVFLTREGCSVWRTTSMSCTSGGRLVGRDWIEGDTSSGLTAVEGLGGWLVGRLVVVFTTLSLSWADASTVKPTKTKTAAANRYEIFFKLFKT